MSKIYQTPILLKGYHHDHNPVNDYKTAKQPLPTSTGWTNPDYKPPTSDDIQAWLSSGGWVGHLVPEGIHAIDVEDKVKINLIRSLCRRKEICPPMNITNNGVQFIFSTNGGPPIPGASSRITRMGFPVTDRSANKNYLILPTTNGRTWENQEMLDNPPLIPDELLPARDNIDDTTRALAWALGNANREDQLAGYDELDCGFMTLLVSCEISEALINEAFQLAFLNKFDERRTLTMFQRTKERIKNGDPLHGTGSLVKSLKEKGLDQIVSFITKLQRLAGTSYKSNIETIQHKDWPEPIPLPNELPIVKPFDMDFLPSTLVPWAADIIERFQCPPDFVGAAIIAALASVVGRKIAIRPQAKTDWTVVPNIWAILVGRPGVMKSPAMEAALAPLKRLAAQAGEEFKIQNNEYQKTIRLQKIQSEEAEKAARALLKKNPQADVSSLLAVAETDEPSLRRYIVNDSTVAALGELLRYNQNGFLVYRDEMVSLLKGLDREDAAQDRGFYLTAWNGDSSFTIDRIGRGLNLYIPAVCLSLLGSTQPARLVEYVRPAVRGTSGDDGLIQRFSMLVWPDMGSDWKDIDRWPDLEAKQMADKVFQDLDKLNPLDIGAVQDRGLNGEPEGIPYLRFDDEARAVFLEWRRSLESDLRRDDLPPALESHFAKYRKLIPAIALLIHLADGKIGPVGVLSVLTALAWWEYLKTHARRAYAIITTPDVATAKAILHRLRKRDIKVPFSAREIYRNNWSNLSEPEKVRNALAFLEDLDWLVSSSTPPTVQGGRPQVVYTLNPKVVL